MANTLSGKSCCIFSRQITLKYLNIFTGKGSLMMIVSYQATWL